MGQYKEDLKSGGSLIVEENEWYISYYFPGLDRRYNGTVKIIHSSEIDDYIYAWKENFKVYKELKDTLGLNGEFMKYGLKNMTIIIGDILDGVYLDSFNMNVKTDAQLNIIINDYLLAKHRAEKIQKLLKNL